MSHFYSGCQGGRGEATRCGHKTTGIEAYVQSDSCGIKVTACYDPETGIDEFRVILYGGRHGNDECIPLRVASDADGISSKFNKITIFHDVKAHKHMSGVRIQHNLTHSQSEFEFMEDIK